MRTPTVSLLVASCLAPFAAPSFAAAQEASPIFAQTDLQRLANDETWLKLVHYKRGVLPPFGLRSDVVSANFFFAANGATNPSVELEATIAAMIAPVGANPEEHAQCRFPARFSWLKQHVDMSAAPDVACARFDEWIGQQHITSLSLVLASGYLDNPSSFFGHVLLRFNADAADLGERLFDKTLNYGANYPKGENPVFYIAKGLTGGYPSEFTHLDYYQYDVRHSEDEERDAWEYELNLTQDDVDFVVAHAWELMSAQNNYFFLRQNCAFRMAELVNLVVEEPLLPSSKVWALPPDVFEEAAHAKAGGSPLVRKIVRRPSRQSRFRERYFALPSDERADIRAYVADHKDGARQINARAQASRVREIETLIDYYSYLEQGSKAPADDVKTAKNELLLTRMRLPAGEAPDPAPKRAPHEGQGSSMLQLSAVQTNAHVTAVDVRFRAAYYDFLTKAAGAMPYSEMAMGDVTARITEDEVHLRRLDLVRITTLNVSGTELPQDGKGHAWRVRFGAEQANWGCDDCVVGFVEGGYGKAWRLSGDAAVYGFAQGRLTTQDETDTSALAGAAVGAVFGAPTTWRAHVEAGALQTLNGQDETRPYAHAEVRLGGSSHYDFRLGADYQRARGEDFAEARAAIDFFW